MDLEGTISRGSDVPAFLRMEETSGGIVAGIANAPDGDCPKSVFPVAVFQGGLDYLFPLRMGEGINPVTFRGENGVNLTLGRLYFGPEPGTETVKEGQHRIKEKWLKKKVDLFPEKIITAVIWLEGKEAESPLGHVVLDQTSFVTFLERACPTVKVFVAEV